MGCSVSDAYIDLADYKRLCKLLKVKVDLDNMYDHLEEMKKSPLIEWSNYMYQLKYKKIKNKGN